MIDSHLTGDPTRVTSSLVPIVSLAAGQPKRVAGETSTAPWQVRRQSTRSRLAGDIRLPDAWFRTLNEQFKRRVRALFESEPAEHVRKFEPLAETMSELTEPRPSKWEREVTELRRIVNEMRAELANSQTREKHARYLAFHDDLTALPNRRYFLERLGAALQGETPLNLAVIYLDLDGFKTVNDTLGHETGDHLLKLVATRLAHAVRAADLVSRLGGDEYACLITGVSNAERLQQIASTMFDAVSNPFTVDSQVFTVHPSIGIAIYPADGTSPNALMKSADSAMYRAKQRRSGCRCSEQPVAVSRAATHCLRPPPNP